MDKIFDVNQLIESRFTNFDSTQVALLNGCKIGQMKKSDYTDIADWFADFDLKWSNGVQTCVKNGLSRFGRAPLCSWQ